MYMVSSKNKMIIKITHLSAFNTLLICLAANLWAQPISLPGLTQKVTVQRDAYSRPYIAATNEHDLYFAQGYVTASDRLWQMDLMRRLARGETAEIFGRATLEEDKRWRRFGFTGIADQSLQHLSPELRDALKNYAAGVNAYIASLNEASLPIEFRILQYKPRQWTPTDTLVIGKILADALSSTWRLDLLKASLRTLPKEKFDDLADVQTEYDVILFGKDVAPAKRTVTEKLTLPVSESLLSDAQKLERVRESSLARVGMFAEDLAASNNWVISGKRTADGKPILANDPHLQPTAPGIWYMSHLETPTMKVAGVTFPGVPGIVLGHNEYIAWGATNVGPDVQDVFVETFDPSGKVKTADGWAVPNIRKETINVRANPLKPETEAVTLEVVETRNGPVILEEADKKYSLKWTARDPKNNDFAAFFLLNRAKDWKEFTAALSTYRGATQNFVFADTKGNIGWHIAGAIPTRRSGDGSVPYDGSRNEGDWTGLVPFAELPNLYNPPSGFIVTANQRVVGTDYKYTQLVRDFAAPWRARRLYDLLAGEQKFTVESVAAAQFDAYNIPLSNLAKEIVKEKAASPESLTLLESWDGKMTPDSRAALLANEVRGCLAAKIADENKPIPVNAIRERILDRAVRQRSAIWLPSAYPDYPAFFKACDGESVVALEKRYGTDRAGWAWGKVSVSRFIHPLAAAPLIGGQFTAPAVGLVGSGQTPNVASFVSMRLIATPGNWDTTRHTIPLGQSGDPKSSHFKDQFEFWRNGTGLVFPFSKEEIAKAAISRVEFVPVN